MSEIRFGSTLRVLRVARGLSLRGLARKLNVSPAYLSQVENGKLPPPSQDRIVELARTLGVPAHRLFALASKIPPNVADLVEHTPEASQFLLQADAMRLPGPAFQLLSELLERMGADRFMSVVQDLHRSAALGSAEQTAGAVEPAQNGRLEPCLVADLVFADLRQEAWEDVIDSVAEAMVRHLPAVDSDDIATPLTDGTYPDRVCIGGGVAVPHLTLPGVRRPLMAVARLATPLECAAEGELRLVFVLVDGQDDPLRHLGHLARVVQLCSIREAMSALVAAPDRQALHHALVLADRSLG